MNKKRAGLSINMIIVAALGLIVLVIVAFIFRTQVIDYASKYTQTADSAVKSAEGKTCATLFSTRKCSANKPTPGEWTPVSGEWTDCGKDKKCWEEVEKETKPAEPEAEAKK